MKLAPANPNLSVASAQAGFTAATAGNDHDTGHEDDEASIEAYMNGLLAPHAGARSRSAVDVPNTSKTVSTKPTQAAAAPLKQKRVSFEVNRRPSLLVKGPRFNHVRCSSRKITG